MTIATTVLTTLVALEFFYIFYLETLRPHSETTSRVFNMPEEELNRPSVTSLFRNQGVYNGLIGIGLIYSTYFSPASRELTAVLLIYIIAVALYGAVTVDKKIILTQGGLAIIALLTLLI
ncbi:DUF1304 domain-containing protein [Macrococcus brunensis]|uniref:DUF1304 domain-containing protein n=1 Tax=Macrococcus brunensis TaxID=198483 RepID=UPI001EF153C0|nr:DUF1304 domain-containing protein [Macrococcus brunensis]ULG71386.1 DUF1304 domain-containing protein [Macrococcus brunensis]